MEFDHERLDVYKASLNFAELATKLIETFPTGKSHLSDQFKRAFVSISLNIAEGAGEFSRSEKARFYRMSRRSATECAAIVDICKRLELGNSALWTECRINLLSIVSMLVKLIKSMNGKGTGQGQGHPLR
jgi:four helix bundle protein